MTVCPTSQNYLLASYTGKRILVTGGTGFVGANLVGLLKDADCQIVRISRSGATAAPLRWRAKIRDVFGDIRDRAIWESTLPDSDIVFHFAAQTSLSAATENPFADLEINVLPIVHLLETCRHKGLQPIVLFSGTVTEAGIPTRLPVDETHPDKPITMYDLHKLMAENYLKYAVNQKLVRGAILRLPNVYGPGPMNSRSDRGVLNAMVRKALKGETLPLYGNGHCLRDYLYVEDIARAFLMAGVNIECVNGESFVIGSGCGHSLAEAFYLVAEHVALKTGRRVPVTRVEGHRPLTPIETRNFVADPAKFVRATGWRPNYSLGEGIDRTVESYL